MIHGEDIDPHNPPLFVTREPGRYNLPSKGKPFYFFWARVENKATNTKEEEIFDKIIERHELEKQVPVAHALEPEVELDTTEENDKDKPEITTDVLARSSTYERLNSSASNSSGSGINQQQPKETEVKVETTEVEELTGQVPGVHNQFECNEIKGYKVGERYRKKHFNYNPKTKTTATAIIYPAPPGKGNRQQAIRHMRSGEVVGPVISVKEICSGGRIFVTLEVPFPHSTGTTAFINATTATTT